MTGPVHFDQIDWLVDVVSSLNEGKAIRKDFGDGSRLHVDRLLPFLFLHIDGGRNEDVARSVVQANASYLVASDPRSVLPIVKALSMVAAKQFGAFVIVRFAELDRDRFLTDDAPYLPPFEVSVWSSGNAPEVRETFSKAVSANEARFHTPQVEERRMASSKIDGDLAGLAGCALLVAEFAPIYRAPQSGNTFPEVRDQLIATLSDAGLRACAAFIEARGIMKPASHRSLGRRALVEAVNRVDRGIDEIATAFDVLLAVTPINAGQAFHRFEANGFVGDPGFLYRPLTVQVEDAKQRLFPLPLTGSRTRCFTNCTGKSSRKWICSCPWLLRAIARPSSSLDERSMDLSNHCCWLKPNAFWTTSVKTGPTRRQGATTLRRPTVCTLNGRRSR